MFVLIAAAAITGAIADPAPAAVTPGTVTIRAAASATLPAETRQAFDDAVQRALLRARFTPLPGQDHGRYIATVEVTRASRGVVTSDIPASSAPLASLNGSVSLALPPGGDRLSDLVATTLTVVLSRRSDGKVLWSGSAVTVRVTGTRAGAVPLVAGTLADAVLARFPAQADGPIAIP